MKKTILFLAAIFIATQVFSQSVEKITITYNTVDLYNNIGNVNTLELLKEEPYTKNLGPEKAKRVIDLRNMSAYFVSDAVEAITVDIVKYEVLENGIIHIVCDERNILYPEEDNVRIFTHTYVDIKNNLSVYSYVWGDEFYSETFANKAVNPKIVLK
jgi:hypothetical protein